MQQIGEADTKDEAWELARQLAASLRKLGLAGKFTVGVEPNATTQRLGRGITGGKDWRVVLHDEDDLFKASSTTNMKRRINENDIPSSAGDTAGGPG